MKKRMTAMQTGRRPTKRDRRRTIDQEEQKIEDAVHADEDSSTAVGKIKYIWNNIDRLYGNSMNPNSFKTEEFLKDLHEQLDILVSQQAANLSQQLEAIKQRDEERAAMREERERLAAAEAAL